MDKIECKVNTIEKNVNVGFEGLGKKMDGTHVEYRNTGSSGLCLKQDDTA
jgi:hypothetical protein